VKKYVRLLGSATLLAVLIWRVDLAQVARTLAGVCWWWWLGALLCYVASQVVSSLRWQALAVPLGFHRPLRDYVSLYFVGAFFNLLLPTSVGGDVVRAWYLDAGSGKRWPAFLSVLADRLIGLFVLLVVAFTAALLVPQEPLVRGAALGAGATAALGLAFFLLAPLGSGRTEVGRGVRGMVRQVVAVLGLYRRSPRLVLGVTFLSALIQVANAVLVWMLGQGAGLPLPLDYCFVLMPLVALLTLLPISVGGLGVREGAVVVLLASRGIAAGQAVTLSLLWFSVFVAAGLAGAGLYLSGRLPRYEVRTDDEPVGGHPDPGRAGQPRTAA
jgi:glycosyltransferase 2 family protein